METPIDLGDLRQCCECHHFQPRDVDHFFRDSDGPEGWSRKCKDCDNSYQSRRRAAIREGTWEVRPRSYPADNGRWPKKEGGKRSALAS